MAEDEGKIEEVKFEFTSEGEVVGYISQEQASLKAMQHARDNREFYGHRYAQQDLFWEVVGEDQSEDYYQVRVAYRPAQGFKGQPGVEEFTVDKTGPIEFRQIITEPRQASSFTVVTSSVVIIVAAAAFGILLSVGNPDLRSSPVPAPLPDDSAVTARLVPHKSARLKSDEEGLSVFVSAGSVDSPAVLRYDPVPVEDIPPMYPGFVVVRAFELSVTKEEESRPLAFLQNPILINLQLTTADLALAGGVDSLKELDPRSRYSQPVTLRNYRGNQWEGVPANTQVNRETLMVEARIPRLGLFALTIVDRNPTGPNADPYVN